MKKTFTTLLTTLLVIIGGIFLFLGWKGYTLGDLIRGTTTPAGTPIPSPSVGSSATPAPSQPEPSTQANIRVEAPTANATIGLPLVIRGAARVFENTVNYRLKDTDGAQLVESFATAKSPDIGQFGEFEVSASYPQPKGTVGTLEVFTYSAKDGSEIEKVSIPVRFGPVDAMEVKVYFVNRNVAETSDCSAVLPFLRRVPRTQTVARAALEELLKGTTAGEWNSGGQTLIPEGVKIQSLTIANGVARVDFNEALEAGGGACSAQGKRAEIETTLKQFSSVKEVVISVNGRTEDILQP